MRWQEGAPGLPPVLPRAQLFALQQGRAAVLTTAALADAEPRSFWLDSPRRRSRARRCAATRPATSPSSAAASPGCGPRCSPRSATPAATSSLLEARTVGHAASGRNGGFCDASLTHGLGNGIERFPDELDTLERLGLENLDAIEATVARHAIDCAWERTGTIDVATAAWMAADLREELEAARRYGHDVELLDDDAHAGGGALAHLPRPGLWRRTGRRWSTPRGWPGA